MMRILLLAAAVYAADASAEHCATGKIEATVCRGFVIERCSVVDVVGEIDRDGNTRRVRRCFNGVEHRSGICWLHLGGKMSPYLTRKDGKLERVKADYLTFECVERR